MMAAPRTHTHEIAVVGARAAGAATALLAARLGHDVVVVDRALLPSDTLSTHSISRSGVVQLHRWGLLDEVVASGAPPIRRVDFHTPEGSLTRTVRESAGVDFLVAPRRYALDTIVAEAAADAGATVRLGVTVTGLRRDAAGRVTGVIGHDQAGEPVEIAADVVVGADGLHSRVARDAGARVAESRGPTGTTYYAYYHGPLWTGIEFFVTEGALAGVFPTHGGEACIWICVTAAGARAARRRAGSVPEAFERLLARHAPDLSERLAGARRTSPVRGTSRLPNQVRQAWGPGWALVGDALYFRDPITGHGLSDAYRDAELLACALDDGLSDPRGLGPALDRYRRQADVARREIFDLTCELGQFPPPGRFVQLQRQLSMAIETEAAALVARPIPGHGRLAVA
jgi:2-polyprenyl-6-methoxyphenol hydroxylase-like FAD-dependent oxidoreductase